MSQLLVDIYHEKGVTDLPSKVKAHFAKALKAEQDGNKDEAEKQLDLAVKAEQEE